MVHLEMMCKVMISACCIHNIVRDSNERLFEYFTQGEHEDMGFRRGKNVLNQSNVDIDAADKHMQIARDIVPNKIK